MRRRNCKVTLYLNDEELDMLKSKSQGACLDQNRLLRALLHGYEPRPAPDERFWQAMDIIREFADKVDELAMKTDRPVDMIAVMNEARKWRMFQNAIEKEFLRPKRGDD